MNIFKGISVSNGIGIGNIFFLENLQEINIPKSKVLKTEKKIGWNKFLNALEAIKTHINKKSKSSNSEQEKILQSYLLMLSDNVFINEIQNAYDNNDFNIEHTVSFVVNNYAQKLKNTEDAYLKERATDIEDIFTRVLHYMLGFDFFDFDFIPENSIIVAHSIQPSQAMEILKQNIAGLVLNISGQNSHLAILARSYGIPAIFGINTLEIEHDVSCAILDGLTGTFIVSPDEKTLSLYTNKKQAEKDLNEKRLSLRNKKAISKDGINFNIYANVGSLEDVEKALEFGADGIGLFRTEFLFMQADDKNELLTEETQFEAYKKVLQLMKEKPVTIRTLDIGGDKLLHASSLKTEKECNPLLGNRAIRFCLSNTDIFKTQLRALFRASIFGNLKIMLPLLTTTEQIIETHKIVKAIKTELKQKNIPFAENVPLGIMVETPSAAICSDLFAPLCNFFSIGTNDLTQYTLAVDRENVALSSLYNELDVSVLRLIKQTVLSAQKGNIPISVCGELASNPKGIQILSGLGIRSFSMTPHKICEIKEFLSKNTISDMIEVSEKYLTSK